MARDEVGLLHEVGGADRLGTEAEVGDGDRARLPRVVDEVALGEQPGALADDLHRRLVRPDGAVRAEAVEQGLDLAGRAPDAERAVDREAEVRHVVVDANRELPLRPRLREGVEDRLHHRGRQLLRREPVAPADHPRRDGEPGRIGVHRLGQGTDDVEVQRLADGARLLGPVQDGDRTHGRRQRGQQVGRRERPEQADPEHADALARVHQRVDGLLDRAARRAHHDDHPLGIGSPVVVDQTVSPAGPRRELVEDPFDDPRDGEMERVRRLARLEEHVGVLGGAPDDRGVGGQAACTEGENVLVADQGADVVVTQDGDPVDLVGGPEPVEEVQERDPRPQRGRVGDQREVVGLLDRSGREHRPAGRAGVHHVAVVAEDRQGVGRQRARGDVDHRGRQLAGDLEHVGDHQQEALGCREGGRQRPRLQGAMECSGRARLRLHLDDVGHLAPLVRPPCRSPVVAVLGHRGRRCDRVDRDHLAQRVGDARDRLVAVEALLVLGHPVCLPASISAGASSPIRGLRIRTYAIVGSGVRRQ